MKYMYYSDEDEEKYEVRSGSLMLGWTSLLFTIIIIGLYIVVIYDVVLGIETLDDGVKIFSTFIALPLFDYAWICITIGFMKAGMKYELTEEGICYKWLFGKGIIRWDKLKCYGLFFGFTDQAADNFAKKCRWYIVGFLETDFPRYPVCYYHLRFLLSPETMVYICVDEERLSEFKAYADKKNVPYIGKEGNGRRYECSSWFDSLPGERSDSERTVSGMRLCKGTDEVGRDRIHRRIIRGLVLFLSWGFVLLIVWFVIGLIEEPNPYGGFDIVIAIIAALTLIPFLIQQNDSFALNKEGILLKEGFGKRLVRWEEVKYCGVVLRGFRPRGGITVTGTSIIVSLTERLPEMPVRTDVLRIFDGNDRMMFNCTYPRIEEFKKYADMNGVRWFDCYDEEGNLTLPEGMKVNERWNRTYDQ